MEVEITVSISTMMWSPRGDARPSCSVFNLSLGYAQARLESGPVPNRLNEDPLIEYPLIVVANPNGPSGGDTHSRNTNAPPGIAIIRA